MANKKEVAKTEDQMPAFLKDKMDSNRGSEDVGSDDIVIPRLELVQALSKCRKKTDPAYIEGAAEGNLYNNVTRELYGDSVLVVPVSFRKEYLVWRDQDLGGGFAGAYPTQGEAKTALGEQENPGEWEVVDTHQHFCVMVDADLNVLGEVVISMAKSKAKVSRNWNSLVRINGGDRFTRVYKVSGVEAQNDQGKDYHNLAVVNHGFVNEEVYTYAEGIYEMIQAGNVKADTSVDESDESEGDEF